MSTEREFDYELFSSLQGVALSQYMEAILRNRSLKLREDDIQRLLSEMSQYDEYHLAYALQIGCDHRPDAFIPLVPRFLAHPGAGVCATAYNILDRLRDSAITLSLLNSVRAVVSSGLKWKDLGDIVGKLEARTK